MKRRWLLLVSVVAGIAMTYLSIAAWNHGAYFERSSEWLRRAGVVAALTGFPMWLAGYTVGAWYGIHSDAVGYLPIVFNVVVWAGVVYVIGILVIRARRKCGRVNDDT